MRNEDNDIQNLSGKILLSTPTIPHGYLSKSMIFICSHDKNGAMGVVINKLIPDINVNNILKKLKISEKSIENLHIHFGGSEEIERYFILHSNDYMTSESSLISNNIALSVNGDIIKIVTSVGGPEKKQYAWDAAFGTQSNLKMKSPPATRYQSTPTKH